MTRSLFLQLFCMDTLFSHCLFYAMDYTIIRFLFQVFFKEVLVFSFSYIKIIRPFLCKRTAIWPSPPLSPHFRLRLQKNLQKPIDNVG